ncbi:hypothetical protein FRC19_003093 [Serendipita sp. 401]|nr:hypothetical protein FRC19_003093 [Serendipita sp. 401]
MQPIHSHQHEFQPPSGYSWRDLGDRATTLKNAKNHLQAAVYLELLTIPAYLYAVHSVKSSSAAVKADIMHVVKEEMLHLALAGNTLCSIGGKPRLYCDDIVPEYPRDMLYRKIPLSLNSASKETIGKFMELERPEPPMFALKSNAEFDTYNSIGAFYDAIVQMLESLQRGGTPFIPETKDRQFREGDGSWDEGKLSVVEDIDSAKLAIKTIVDQGEGSMEKPAMPAPNDDAPPSHFQVFERLYNAASQADCYPVLENPKTSKFDNEDFKKVHSVLLLSDAVYCYLLITIERMWDPEFTGKREELVENNLMRLMTRVITPLARFLTQEKGPNDRCFAPFFNFYDFSKSEKTCYDQLVGLMDDAIKAYEGDAAKKQQLTEISDKYVKKLIPLQPYCHRPGSKPAA